MNEKTNENKIIAPYIPFKSFKSFVERLHNTATPPVIDPSLLQHMSGSMKGQIMSTLKFLNLIESNGATKKELKELVKSYKTDTWTNSLSNVIFGAYKNVTGDLDLNSGTDSQLYDKFKKNGNVDGQMLDKAVRFFLGALKEMEVTYSPHFGARKISQSSTRKQKKKSKKKTKNEFDDEFDDLPNDSKTAKFRIPIPDKNDVMIALPSDITEGDWEMVKVMLDAYVKRITREGT